MKFKKKLIGILIPLIVLALVHVASMLQNDFSPVIPAVLAPEAITQDGDFVRVEALPRISASAGCDVNPLYGGVSLQAGASGDLYTKGDGADQIFSVTGIVGGAYATTPATAPGDIRIIYKYPPPALPEPDLLLLLFMAGLFLMLVRRRGDRNRGPLNQIPVWVYPSLSRGN